MAKNWCSVVFNIIISNVFAAYTSVSKPALSDSPHMIGAN